MKTLIIHLCVMVLVTASSAQDGPGGTAGAPFRLGSDARSIGMGNAMIALPLTDNPSIANPALLPYLVSRSVLTGAALLPLDRSVFHLSYSTPLPPSAGLALSVVGARVGDIQGRDVNGMPTESYSTGEYAFSLGFGLQPAPGFTIGAAAKLFYAQLLPEMSSTTVGLDFGASYLVSRDVAVAIAFRDLNSKYRWDSTPVYGRNGNNTVDLFPRRFIFGASWSPADLPFKLAAEGESISGVVLFRAGLEYSIHPGIHVRAGLDGLEPDGQTGTRLSLGASIAGLGIVWNPSIDYAFLIEPMVYAGAHFLTIRFHLGE